jgi:hypothetical protein
MYPQHNNKKINKNLPKKRNCWMPNELLVSHQANFGTQSQVHHMGIPHPLGHSNGQETGMRSKSV